jgi:hypothetical protein
MVESGILNMLEVEQKPREKVSPSAGDAQFLPEQDIKDAAVEFALRRINLEEGLTHISTAYIAKEEGVKEQYEPELELHATNLHKNQIQIEEEKNSLDNIGQKTETLNSVKNSLSDKIQELRFNIYITVQEIRKKRLEKEKKLFQSEEAKLKTEADHGYDEVIQGVEKQIEVAQRLYALDKRRWEINKPEYERRISELKKEKERVEEEVNIVRNSINDLKRFGITRHTASFMIWAGYASLAGVGGVIANLLSGKPQGAGTDYISLTFQYLTNIVKGLQAAKSWSELALNVIWPSVIVIGILAVTGALIYLTDSILKGFYKGWQENWQEKLKNRKRFRKGKRADSERNDSREQPPLLTPAINRLSIPLPEVNRKSYVKLLALLPYLFLAFVIVVLSVSGSNQSNPASGATVGGQGGDTSALSMTYVGIVFTLLTVSVSMLYATKVIEPRWRKLSKILKEQQASNLKTDASPEDNEPPQQVSFRMYLRAHWEFITIMCAMLLALILAAILPAQNHRYYAIWGTVAIFMCFSSMALAYGIIQRGLFRSEDYLDGKRNIYRGLIEKYSMEPTIVDVFETVDPDKVKGIIDGYRRSRQDLDELRLLYELKRHFADNYMDDKDILKYWSSLKNWANPLGFMKDLPFRKFEPTEPDLVDYESAPEETRAINQFREERLHTRNKLEEVAEKIAQMEKSRIESKARLRELEREITEQEKRAIALKQSYEQEKTRLRVQREADCLTFKAAYSLGTQVADFIEL